MSKHDNLYFEDFSAGQAYTSETYEITAERIRQFAAEFDPQPFHLDAEAARSSFFGGLAASGWHTAAVAMRLRVQLLRVHGGLIGAGIEDIRWTKPVFAGDSIRVREEITGVRLLATRSDFGLLKLLSTTTNQRGETVMTMQISALAPRRSSTMV